MADETKNYGFPKPGEDDFYDIGIFNLAMDRADEAIKEAEEKTGRHCMDKGIHITEEEREKWDSSLLSTGDSKDNTVTFNSGDAINPTGWADVGLVESGEEHKSLWRKVSLFAKNMRYLWKLYGANDISKLGDGTLTGAISKLNTDLVVAKAWKTSAVSFMACTGETSGITVESFLDRVVSEAAASNTAHGDSFQSIVGAVEGPIFCALTVIHSTKKYYGGFAFTYSNRYQAAQFFCEGGLYGIRFP